jgi:mannose-1-phosphate guanylyltransferase
MNKDLYVVLMAGGVGVRFWPYSRNSKPKQFLDVLGTGRTLLQSTYDRFLPLCPPENIFVITHEEHATLVQEQLPELSSGQILKEPMRKNTAPCIAYASFKIRLLNKNAVVIVTPSDQLILKEEDFRQTITKAVSHASKQDKLITLGISPTRPETGYGYIQYIEAKGAVKKVKTFTEKPALAIAKKFLESGDFVWNAGIFIWSVNTIIQSLKEHQSELAEVFEEIEVYLNTNEEASQLERAYGQCKNISIDYALLEKAENVYVCLGHFSWSDLGSWGSIHEISEKNADNNVIQGKALTYDTRNSIIKGSKNTLIVVQGLNGYLVGEFGNVIIVCEKDKEDQFRKFVNDVKALPESGDFL